MSRKKKLLLAAVPISVWFVFHLLVVALNYSGPELKRIGKTWRADIGGQGVRRLMVSGDDIMVLRDMLIEMRPSWNPIASIGARWSGRDRSSERAVEQRSFTSDWRVYLTNQRKDGTWEVISIHANDGVAFIHEPFEPFGSSRVVVADIAVEDLLRRFQPLQSSSEANDIGKEGSRRAP